MMKLPLMFLPNYLLVLQPLYLLQILLPLYPLLHLPKMNQDNCHTVWSLSSIVDVMLDPLEASWC